MTAVDRRAVKAILALCDIELRDFAESLGYDSGYVSNVLTGATPPSRRSAAPSATRSQSWSR